MSKYNWGIKSKAHQRKQLQWQREKRDYNFMEEDIKNMITSALERHIFPMINKLAHYKYDARIKKIDLFVQDFINQFSQGYPNQIINFEIDHTVIIFDIHIAVNEFNKINFKNSVNFGTVLNG